MKPTIFIVCFLMLNSAQAEILDRIVAVVNNRIITLSDLQREREIRIVLGSKEAQDNKMILHDLIDSKIIDDQITQFPGIEVTDDQVDAEAARHTDLRGVPLRELRETILHRLRTAEFIQVRFRQFIRPTDEEIRQYYQTVFLPRAEKDGLNPAPSLDQMTEDVRNNVIEEKVAHDVENWLDAIRRRSDIEVFE